MSAAKHSPGPWEANGPFVNSVAVTGIADCSRADIAENWAGSDYSSHAHAEANARLIATAPELLEALRRLEVAANTVAYCHDKHRGNFAAALSDMESEAEAARAAIAKATGAKP